MASLVTRKSGLRFVQFVNNVGKRKTVTLDTIAPREAGRIRDKIEELATARRNGIEPSPEAANWLVKIGDDLHAKLVAVGLAFPRKSAPTLSEFVEVYDASRTDWKDRSRSNFEQATRQLRKHFGDDRLCNCITEAPEGTEHVILRLRGENSRTQFGRIIRKAGLKPWPKLWTSCKMRCWPACGTSTSSSTAAREHS